ncbi:hypothetical protein BCR39DRAFT_505983 [Naematelia encephala]|uniref:Uncharacterized protein n=1 Tax=Naematelia encephala TaxID=71784 RepID=A0A1Y2B038_9TREE|nr:hypothetical protein BCR39DRAFT_505983 [Naematelia encephala]
MVTPESTGKSTFRRRKLVNGPVTLLHPTPDDRKTWYSGHREVANRDFGEFGTYDQLDAKAQSLYVPTGSSPIGEVNEKQGFDLNAARRIAKNSRGYVRDPTPELLAISSGGRDPVPDSDPPFIHPDEVARHDNVIDGILSHLPRDYSRRSSI